MAEYKPVEIKEVSHHEAYELNMIIQNVTPYPTEFGISFSPNISLMAFLFISVSFLVPNLLDSVSIVPLISRILFIIGVVLIFGSIYPTWSPFFVRRWKSIKDNLITEYRTKKIRSRYWRNFYDS